VLNLFNNNDEGIFPVGRLDKDSEGLLFLTNDGDFANSLIHPKHEIEKVYEVIVNKKLHEKELDSLRSGVRLKEGKTKPCEITLIRTTASSTELIFVLKQGLNRQIRRMVETLEAEVTFLRRTFIGGIGLAGMKPGETRKLGYNELNELKKNANT
jgi:23S rRNA pseudouridine2605 synthase